MRAFQNFQFQCFSTRSMSPRPTGSSREVSEPGAVSRRKAASSWSVQCSGRRNSYKERQIRLSWNLKPRHNLNLSTSVDRRQGRSHHEVIWSVRPQGLVAQHNIVFAPAPPNRRTASLRPLNRPDSTPRHHRRVVRVSDAPVWPPSTTTLPTMRHG
jgi:hypothetical protein